MLLLEPWVHHMLVPLPAVFQGLRAWTWPSAKVKLVRTAAMALERPVDIVLAGIDTAPQVGGAAVVVLGDEDEGGRRLDLAAGDGALPAHGQLGARGGGEAAGGAAAAVAVVGDGEVLARHGRVLKK